jgi:glycosyltransferase involved in cell wall biosynthesis
VRDGGVSRLISVVIPTYRRPALLARCLAAVLAQDIGSEAYEVIVVDDEPAEATRRIVERFATMATAAPALVPAGAAADEPSRCNAGARIRYVSTGDAHGPAAARNAGWRAAAGNVVAFTDDDCIPAPGWLRAGVAALTDGVSGADGRVIVPMPDSPTDAEHNLAGLERSRFLTANCFYRRCAIEERDGFDERFRLPWREDSDLYFALLERGHRFVRAPGAIVVHPVRSPAWGSSLGEQRKSMYNALLYRKHPALYRARVQGRPPLRYYGTVAVFAFAVWSLARRRRRSAAAGSIAWGVATLEFAGERLRRTSRRPSHVAEMLLTSALIPFLSVYWRLRGAWRFRTIFF